MRKSKHYAPLALLFFEWIFFYSIDENLLDNATKQGEYLKAQLFKLKEKFSIIGDVRGQGLFVGLELVTDRNSKEPVHENVVMKIAAHCQNISGVMIGRTNRSFRDFNNTIALSPALIVTESDIDEIISALELAFSELTT